MTNIQGYSIHDGPGIRTVVFLKGCPLRCKWCANPENLAPEPQTGFLERLCTRCGRCFGSCPNGAIVESPDEYRIDRKLCRSCGECVSRCFYGALVRYGEQMTSREVFEKTRRDKMFYDSSGGGVTVSGGEPLMYAGFVAELFELLRGDGINTCVETCGHVPWEAFRAVLPYTDYFLFDFKHTDGEKHRVYTGADNARILDNAACLCESGADIVFRRPLIPGCNDGDGEIEAAAALLKSLTDTPELQLMPYHRMGQTKYGALQMPYEMGETAPMDMKAAEAAREKFAALGIGCTVSK